MKILSIDLGGTSSKIALFDKNKIIKKWNIKTNLNDIWWNIKNNLTNLKDEEYEIVSLSIPGFIDHEKGIIKLSGNLNLKNYSIQENVKKIFNNKKIFSINDANAAALGEFWKGAAKKDHSTILYTLGTGIGGGIIINNELVYGSNGYAGELGHGGNFQNKWSCTCGLNNCIEPVSSATGITRSLKENGFKISVKEAGELLKKGNKKIINIFKESLKPLALHITIMQTAFNPNSIIIGGGPSNIGEPLRKIIEQLVKENQLNFISSTTKIKIAETKNDAGVYGAAYWAIYNLKKH